MTIKRIQKWDVSSCTLLQCFHLSLNAIFFGNFQLAFFSFQVKTELATSIEEGKGEVKIVPKTLDSIMVRKCIKCGL